MRRIQCNDIHLTCGVPDTCTGHVVYIMQCISVHKCGIITSNHGNYGNVLLYLQVLSSLLTRCFTTPFHSLSATLGTSIRALMSEIPLPWQPFFIATILVVILFGVVATCRYRVIMPLFLRIEPSHKTPVIIRTCGSSNCIKAAKIKYQNRRILAIECSPGDDKRKYCKVGDDLDCSSEIIDLSDSFWFVNSLNTVRPVFKVHSDERTIWIVTYAVNISSRGTVIRGRFLSTVTYLPHVKAPVM